MKSSNLQPVTHDVFGVLISEIINESFNYGKTNNIDFNTKSGKALTYGFDKGKDHPASIKALMIKKLDISELDGKELYEYVVEFEKKRPVVIKKKYLQIYVEYIGFNSFTSFLKHQEISDFNRKEQTSLFEDFNNTITIYE